MLLPTCEVIVLLRRALKNLQITELGYRPWTPTSPGHGREQLGQGVFRLKRFYSVKQVSTYEVENILCTVLTCEILPFCKHRRKRNITRARY